MPYKKTVSQIIENGNKNSGGYLLQSSCVQRSVNSQCYNYCISLISVACTIELKFFLSYFLLLREDENMLELKRIIELLFMPSSELYIKAEFKTKIHYRMDDALVIHAREQGILFNNQDPGYFGDALVSLDMPCIEMPTIKFVFNSLKVCEESDLLEYFL
jgi:hypothetical protein